MAHHRHVDSDPHRSIGRPSAPPGPAPSCRDVSTLSREEFEAVVDAALDDVPDELARLAENVVVLVEDEPPPEEPDLLGLYVGAPLTDPEAAFGHLPAQIFVYRGPLERTCRDEEELRDEIRITVVHEIAHHFGIDDERLHALGYG